MKKNYYMLMGIAVIILAVLISGCTQNQQQNSSNSTNSKNNSQSTVVIQNFTFTPNTLTVKAGTNVTWINQDSAIHDIKSNSGTFSSPDLNKGDKYTYNFTKPGEYSYYCGEHPSMTGKIIVQ